MRWLLFLILISCTEEEDMRLFVSSIAAGGGVTPPDIEYKMIDTDFSDTIGWTNNGFTVNNGLEASGVGGMGFNIQYNDLTYLDRQSQEIEVVINDVNSKFALAKGLVNPGTVGTVDLSTNTIYMGVVRDGSNEPIYDWSTPITIPISLGQTYVLRLTKSRNQSSVIFYNKNMPSTYDELMVDYDIDNSIGWGEYRPKLSIVFFKGDIKINNYIFASLVRFTPKVAIYGDSFIEGNSLISFTGSKHNRYADKMYVTNNNDMILSGFGGCNTTNTVGYIDFEQGYIKPTYTIIALGTNDSVYATWEANILSLISKVEAIGSIPVICTLAPRSDRQAFLNQANDYVLNTLSLSYDVIDLSASVTTNGDRLNWVTEYLLPDGVHPSVAGHQAIYDWIVANNNYLV